MSDREYCPAFARRDPEPCPLKKWECQERHIHHAREEDWPRRPLVIGPAAHHPDWEPIFDREDEEPTRLLAGALIHRVPFHVQAVRVKRNGAGVLVAFHSDDDTELDTAFALDDDACPQVVEIEGFPGEWVVYAHAHGD